MKFKIQSAVVAMLAVVVCFASNANAQQRAVTQQQGGSAASQVRVAPAVSPLPSTPRLGFMGQMLNGYGMRVLGTNFNSPASRAGLERGDIIFSINGRRILSQYDYNSALMNAAMYQGGYVSMMVRNVRYDMGLSYQEFVNTSTFVNSVAMPVVGAPQVYSGQPAVQASGQMGGQSQIVGQQRSGQVRRSEAGGQQLKQRQGGQQRQAVREIKASEVPAMTDSSAGSDQ